MATKPIADPNTTTITIQNGEPSSDSVTISAGDELIFENEDNEDYLLELFTQGNNHRIDLCPVLPANGSLSYYPDPSNANGNGRCHYNVLTMSGEPTRPTDNNGSNVIIIGSGK
jgi:hypothetical protein